MRTSQLLLRRAAPEVGASPGWATLQRGGYASVLGPGLVGGGSLLEATLARLEALLVADLPLPRASLAVSDGDALINLLLQHGALAGGPRGAYALAAGFRADAGPSTGLAGLRLYRRLDVAWLTGAGPGLAPLDPDAQLAAVLARLGLERRRVDGAPGTARALTSLPGGAEVELYALSERSLGPVGGGRAVALLSLDLHALLGCLAERHHDERGPGWPAALAPFAAGLLPVAAASLALAEKLHAQLGAAGVDLLLDDRGRDAAGAREDLWAFGLPALVLLSPGAAAGSVVLEQRVGCSERVALADLPARLGARAVPRRRRLLL